MSGLPEGYRLLELGDVDSTNAEAARQFEKGEAGPLWITAKRQIKGRGRAGRTWVSVDGNFYATLLLTIEAPPASASQISFVAGLAVHDAVSAHVAGDTEISLKWPNDILANGSKLAGLLCETVDISDNSITLAIGCGVNLAGFPQHTTYGAASLRDFGVKTEPRAFLEVLAQSMRERLAQWQAGRGFDLIRKAWQERAAWISQTVTVDTGNQQTAGEFEGLNADGALILKLPDGSRQTFYAGDVSLRGPR